MSYNVLKPELVWIDGRCYRNTDTFVDINTFQEHDLYENDTIYKDSDENDEDDNMEVVELDDSRYSTSFHVSKHYLGSIIGRKGYTKSRIEHETKTEIKIPRQGKDGDITILGPSATSVKTARRRINMIVLSSRMKQKPTHFISIPMNKPDIVNSFIQFKELVLRECQSRGIEESIFIQPNKVHLTMGVMCLMDSEERTFASKVLTDAKEKVVMPLLQGHLPLKIRVKGLSYMNDDPKDINVLYANVEEFDSTSDVLQQLANEVVAYFSREGLMKKEDWDPVNVKLHVTLLNSKYRNDLGSSRRESFDGSEILRKFGDYEFGVMELSEIHLSQRHALGPDGYYQPTFITSIP
ncbi:activating signal cointegrator 1 complex subunit 1-like isoform X1 [Cydia pomonella]|uniref:activating signal cointegrator 1 complex subunit 1-like isoform X1 n=2 Tax=Cydia pomonella TaxID=82600 RepID=UPI002ADE0C5F|nr:activating signal cointegrator 1 complex subunit 1-like isoform X1 [Cydia pomonella]